MTNPYESPTHCENTPHVSLLAPFALGLLLFGPLTVLLAALIDRPLGHLGCLIVIVLTATWWLCVASAAFYFRPIIQ